MNRKPGIVQAVLVALIAGCSAGPTQSTSTQSTPTGTALDPRFAARLPDGDGLQNAAKVGPALYRGAQPTPDGYDALRRRGIKTVISFRRFHSSREEVESAGLDYLRIPIYASVGSSAPEPEQVQRFFATVLDPAKQPVFIHCKHGKDRTGMMAALYRIERQGWTNAEAIEEMQAFGYHDVFDDLIDYVREYRPRGF